MSFVLPPLDGLCPVRGDCLELAFPQVAPLRDGVSEEGVYCPDDTLGCVPSGMGKGAYLCMGQRLHGMCVVC